MRTAGSIAAWFILAASAIVFVALAALAGRSVSWADEIDLLRYRMDTGFETGSIWLGSYKGQVCVGVARVWWRDAPSPGNPPVTHLRVSRTARRPRVSTSLEGFWPQSRSRAVFGFAWQWDQAIVRFPPGGNDVIGATIIRRPHDIPFGSSITVNEASRRLVIPVWLPMLAVTGMAVVGCRALLRVRNRRRRGLCTKCGYDLRSSPVQCPECGQRAEQGAKRRTQHRRRDEHECHSVSP